MAEQLMTRIGVLISVNLKISGAIIQARLYVNNLRKSEVQIMSDKAMSESALKAKREYYREYRESHKEQIKEYQARYRESHKEQIKENQARYWELKAKAM